MHGFKGERTLMRIHIGERDRWLGRPLYQAIVELLRQRHYAGATVVRAVMGFGAASRLRTERVEVLSLDLPIVIECVDTEERIAEILPELDGMIGGGLITLERARVIMYRPDLQTHERTSSWEIERTGRWQPDPPPLPPGA
jgi:PII-like signaling protein